MQDEILEIDDKNLIPNEKAMSMLCIKTKSSMSRLARQEGLNSVKKWKEVFYYKDEIRKLKAYRESNPHKKSSSKRALQRQIAHNKLKDKNPLKLEVNGEVAKFDEAVLQGNIEVQFIKLREIFKSLGLFLEIDAPLIKAYLKDAYFLDAIRQSLSGGITATDEKGREWLSAEFEGYLKLSELQIKREKALGIGAGNRKGVDANPPIVADEMDTLIDE